MRNIFFSLLLIFPVFGFVETPDKELEIKKLVKVIEDSKAEVFEEVSYIPRDILNQLTEILKSEYDIENEFVLNEKYAAPARSYDFNKGIYRRLNFGLNKGNKWVISYHISTKRFSYNNILYLDLSRKETIVKSFQIYRPSNNPEGLLKKLNDPKSVELTYHSREGISENIF
ncbi:MAG: hypothetical protein AAF363_04745 [Bacteroidota bacterium]